MRGGVQEPLHVLHVRDLTNGRERLLVDPKADEWIAGPLWSPDGRHILYQVTAGPDHILRVVSLSASTIRTIAQSTVPMPIRVWSPDSRYVGFGTRKSNADPYDVTVVNIATGESRSVGTTSPTWAGLVWSTDSRRVAFMPADPKQALTEIAIASIETGERQTIRISAPPANGRNILTEWLPSDHIAFRQQVPQASNDRFIVPANGGDVKRICEGRASSGGDGCQAITEDGRYQIVRRTVSDGGRMVFREIATGEERTLTVDSVTEQPAVLPSAAGRLVAFRSNRDGRPGVYVAPIDRLPVARPIWIADLEEGGGASGWWTRDGLVLRLNTRRENIYRVDMDPKTGRPVGSVRQLTQETPVNHQPHPSPDGRRIAYVIRGGKVGIAVMDANGANERIVYESPADLMPLGQNLAWRSDDELVLFQTGGTQSQPFSLLNLKTGVRTPSSQPELAGNGKRYLRSTDEIVRWGSGGDRLAARSVATGAERTIALPDRDIIVYFTITPDGGSVIYSTADESGGRGRPIPGDIRIVPSAGGETRVLIKYDNSNGGSDHYPLQVSPNGKFLLYQDPQRALRVMNLETTESWPLLIDPPAGTGFGWPRGIAWSPDGSYVVFPGQQNRTKWRYIQGVTYNAVVRQMESGKR